MTVRAGQAWWLKDSYTGRAQIYLILRVSEEGKADLLELEEGYQSWDWAQDMAEDDRDGTDPDGWRMHRGENEP